jgi:hypothetical protein
MDTDIREAENAVSPLSPSTLRERHRYRSSERIWRQNLLVSACIVPVGFNVRRKSSRLIRLIVEDAKV